jgi:SSS family solute:Na+ symporter
MYLGVIIAAIFLSTAIPGGWSSVNDYYVSNDQSWMLSLWANADTWKTYIIGTILGQLFFVPVNQAGCQCSISAKNVRTLKRSVFLAVPLNCIFGIFMIAFGMAANTLTDYAGVYGGPMDTFAMLVDLLPSWVVVWLLAGFAAAILSTIAVCVMGISTVFVNDIVKPRNPGMSDATHMKWLRGAIIVIAGLACITSTLLPSVNTSMVWLFSWLLPAFWMFVFGMHWKRSCRAALATTIICAIVNCIWSFSDMASILHMDGNNNSIVMLVFTMVVGAVLTALDKDAKPSLVSLYKKDKQLVVSSKTL